MRRRAFGIGAVVASVAGAGFPGCSSRNLDVTPKQPPAVIEPSPFDRTAGWPAFALTVTSDPRPAPVDVLFMVDDSSSMRGFQEQVARGFDAFLTTIDAAFGGNADLHIGVVSADMGAGDGSISGCMTTTVRGAGGAAGGGGNEFRVEGSDDGRLQATPRGPCTATTLASGQNFIALSTDPVTGQRVSNFSAASASDVFSCIAVMGDEGCGFERPFSSVQRALHPMLAPVQNAGFLRRHAFLAVILVSNEDDCSAAEGIPLYDTSSNLTLGSKLGPPANFRCNEFGHVCMIDGMMQPPPRAATGPLERCQSAEVDGLLEPVAGFVAFLRSLKSDPAMVFVGAMAGPPAPYQVETKPPSIADVGPWPVVAHSCTTASGAFADPAVRINELAASLGSRGAFETICAGDMAVPLQRIARAITQPFTTPCVTPPASVAGCEVVDRWVDSSGGKHVDPIASCQDPARNGGQPCWVFDDHAACPSGTRRVRISRSDSPPPDVITAVRCVAPPPIN